MTRSSITHALSAEAVNPDIGTLRVGQLIESDGPGGAESVVLELCSELSLRGLEVHPAVFGGGEGWLSGRLLARGFRPFLPRIGRRLPIDPTLIWRLYQWVKRERLELLHAHDFTMSLYTSIVARIANVPYVITMHGGTYYASAEKRRRALRWAGLRAGAFVGVSDATCTQLVESLALSPNSVTCVPNGVPAPTGDRDAARQRLGVNESERLILAVGNLYPVKGHRTLIEAAGELESRGGTPPWRVAIAGRGDEEVWLRERISQLGLEERVHLLGLRSDIGDLLMAADLWVMPSLSEGLPMALLEAMFCALPIVATNVGGIPAVIDDQKNGRLVPPNDQHSLTEALERLLADPDRARQLGRAARETVLGEYSLSRMADRYLALYASSMTNHLG